MALIDILPAIRTIRHPLHDEQSRIELIDIMPRLVEAGRSIDECIANAARTSLGNEEKKYSRERNIALIEYLYKNKHTSPFEMVETKWHIVMPISVSRQWVRHRTASLNEFSTRYSEVEGMYLPTMLTGQDGENFQKGGIELPECVEDHAKILMSKSMNESMETYKELLKLGVCKEEARGVLPLNSYTKMIWKMDLHNLLHFLMLRLPGKAQYEIRQYACAIADIMEEACPIVMKLFYEERNQ